MIVTKETQICEKGRFFFKLTGFSSKACVFEGEGHS